MGKNELLNEGFIHLKGVGGIKKMHFLCNYLRNHFYQLVSYETQKIMLSSTKSKMHGSNKK